MKCFGGHPKKSINPVLELDGCKKDESIVGGFKILIAIAFFVLSFFVLTKDTFAAIYYWTGASGASINDAANWSTTLNAACGVSTGGAVPGAADTAIFTSACTNSASIDFGWTVSNLTVQSGYTGTLTQTAGLTVSVALSANAGTLNIADQSLNVGTLTVNGGTIAGTTGIVTGTTYNLQTGTTSAILGGTGSVSKTSAGTMIVSGNNTYSGPTNVSSGTFILTGNNTTSGLITVTGLGTLRVSGDNSGMIGGITLNSGASLNINSATALGTGTFTINGGTIGKTTTGAIILSTNTPVVVNGDFLFFSTASLTFGSSTSFTLTGNRQITVSASSGSVLTLNGVISDGGNGYSLKWIGGGSVVLNGNNTYTGSTTLTSSAVVALNGNNSAMSGGITIDSGTLRFGTSTALGTGSLIINGGTLDNTVSLTVSTNNKQYWNNDFTFWGRATLNLGTGDVILAKSVRINMTNSGGGLLTVGGVISDGGNGYGLTETGNDQNCTLILNAANTYSGTTTISSGVLRLNNALAAQNSTVEVNIASGLRFGPSIGTFTIGGLAGTSTFALSDTGSAAVTLRAGQNNANTSYSGVMTGAGAFTKQGNGKLTLSAANTYTGTTTISAGILAQGINDAIRSARTIISSGATLDLASYDLTLAGSTSFINNGTLRLYGDQTVTNTPTNSIGSTVDYSAPSGSRTIKSWTYTNSTLKTSGVGTFVLPATQTLAGVTLAAGTLNSGGFDINLTGNWSNTGGAFAGAGTVNFVGSNHTVSGDTTFNNFNIDKTNSPTISFTSGTTQTILGNFTAAGDATHQITIGATAASTAALSKTSGTVSCSYCTLSYSLVTGGASWQAYFTNGNINGGNNTGWQFEQGSSKAIIGFSIPSQVGASSINESNHTISVIMPIGTDVTSLTPTITHTGASVNPASGASRDFTNPVTYTVTAEDNSTQTYTVTVSITSNNTNITSFDFATPSITGIVNNTAHTVTLTVPQSTNITSLTPSIVLASSGATISPASGVAQNFTNPVTYTVTAQDQVTVQTYTVTVNVTNNVNKSIIGFSIPNQTGTTTINESTHTIYLAFPFGTALTSLTPTISHTGASISPASGVAQNFTNPITYTVTDGEGGTQDYTVRAFASPYPEPEYLIVSGTTTPDVSGIYAMDPTYNGGIYNGSVYYSRVSDSAFHIWRNGSLDWRITRLHPTQLWSLDLGFAPPSVRPLMIGSYIFSQGTGSGSTTVSVYDPNSTSTTPVILPIPLPTTIPSYPGRIQITGNLSPDATGYYNASVDTYNGSVYWTRDDGVYKLWYANSNVWYLSTALGNTTNSWRWNFLLSSLAQNYYSNSTNGTYTGTALPNRADPNFPTPGQYMASLTNSPVFKVGHTLPSLTKFSWPYSFEMTKEMARWGYALNFGDVSASTIASLSNPNSFESKLLALVEGDPSFYKLSVNMAREYIDGSPDSAYIHDSSGNLVSPKTYSPEAPTNVLISVASTTASYIRQIASRVPIEIILNGGERGMGVTGNNGAQWAQDPAVIDSKGTLTWFDYSSRQKLHQDKYFIDAAHAASNNAMYLYYGASPNYIKNVMYAEDWKNWGYDYKVVQSISDIPNSETYYLTDGGWTAIDRRDALSLVLNGIGQASTFGKFLSYNWVCGGYNTNPLSSDNSDLGLYTGFLKTYYTAGMIGGNAGYYGYPDGGFDTMIDKDAPPDWIRQIEVLGHVHAEFSYFEDMERNGDLLKGDGANHVWSSDQPTYEFWTGFYNTRVLARKLRGYKRWLITAWAADAIPRNVSVNIPDLGKVDLLAQPAGSIYDARIVSGVKSVTLIDSGLLKPTLNGGIALPSSTPDADGVAYPSVVLSASATLITIGDAITLSSSASNLYAAYSSTKFMANNALLNVDNYTPTSYSWTPTEPGTYSVVAVTGDAEKNYVVSSPVTVTVLPVQSYTVGGNIAGLNGTVVLRNNGGDNLSLSSSGSFTFSTPVAHNNSYDVTVLTQPGGQTCTVSSGSGTINSSNVSNVSIICTSNLSIPSTPSGSGSGSGSTPTTPSSSSGSSQPSSSGTALRQLNNLISMGSKEALSAYVEKNRSILVALQDQGQQLPLQVVSLLKETRPAYSTLNVNYESSENIDVSSGDIPKVSTKSATTTTANASTTDVLFDPNDFPSKTSVISTTIEGDNEENEPVNTTVNEPEQTKTKVNKSWWSYIVEFIKSIF